LRCKGNIQKIPFFEDNSPNLLNSLGSPGAEPRFDSVRSQRETFGNDIMLGYALIFLLLALIAGYLGFFGLAGLAASIAKILLVVFVILLIVSAFSGVVRGRPPI
jgi:uncharacterized membrane protein YtjA (UPF0391 family)